MPDCPDGLPTTLSVTITSDPLTIVQVGSVLSGFGSARIVTLTAEITPDSMVAADGEVRVGSPRLMLMGWQGTRIGLLALGEGDHESYWTVTQAALPHLAVCAAILVTHTEQVLGCWRGRGSLLVPWLLRNGWRVTQRGDGWVMLTRRPTT
jgi:hypothetical protein